MLKPAARRIEIDTKVKQNPFVPGLESDPALSTGSYSNGCYLLPDVPAAFSFTPYLASAEKLNRVLHRNQTFYSHL